MQCLCREVLFLVLVSVRGEAESDQREVKRLDIRQIVPHVVHLAQVHLERHTIGWVLNALELNNHVAGRHLIERVRESVHTHVLDHKDWVLTPNTRNSYEDG